MKQASGTVTYHLGITGMRDKHCATDIQEQLHQVAGVLQVNVDFAKHTATITTTAELATILLSLEEMGYSGHLLTEQIADTDRVLVIAEEGEAQQKLIQHIELGELVRVVPGATVPVDGVIVSGTSYVDEMALTGAVAGVLKMTRDFVMAGSINKSADIIVKTSAVGQATILAQRQAVLHTSLSSTPNMLRWLHKMSLVILGWLLLVIISNVCWSYFFVPKLSKLALLRDNIFLLLLSGFVMLPMMGKRIWRYCVEITASRGVIIKKHEALTHLATAKCLVLPTVPLIQKNMPVVTAVYPQEQSTLDFLLPLAASVSRQSQQAMAKAILAFTQEHNANTQAVTQFTEELGYGMQAEMAGEQVLIGNAVFMRAHAVELSSLQEVQHYFSEQGQHCVFLAREQQLCGLFALADVKYPHISDVMQQLRQLQVSSLLLSTESEVTTRALCQEIGGDDFIAELDATEIRLKVGELQQSPDNLVIATEQIAAATVMLFDPLQHHFTQLPAEIVLMRPSLQVLTDTIQLAQLSTRKIKMWGWGLLFYNVLVLPWLLLVL